MKLQSFFPVLDLHTGLDANSVARGTRFGRGDLSRERKLCSCRSYDIPAGEASGEVAEDT